MRKVIIIYANFYNKIGSELTIGGIQTYIKMLISVINDLDMKPIVVQYADVDFQKEFEKADVYGVRVDEKWSEKKKKKVMMNNINKIYTPEEDLIIYASDIMFMKSNFKKVIGIQHGISWDIKKYENIPHFANMLFVIVKAYRALKTVIRANNFDILVAVDYNFLNWYRTQVAYLETEVKVIPNCTDVDNFQKKETDNINIIFARRFNEYRGTRIFAEAIKKLLNIRNNIDITFAGEGPDELYLKENFKGYRNVNFIKYDSVDSLEIHKNYQIAVVPTIGSEGTSLSLLEAMAAKCAVVATNVGGITNIILDGYNGLLVNPNSDDLFEAMLKLIDDTNLRNEMSQNAFLTVSKSFSREVWNSRWRHVITEIASNNLEDK